MKKNHIIIIVFWLFLLSFIRADAQGYKTRFVVAKDGSGDYTSIQAAVDGAKAFPGLEITIFIKKGIYEEKVTVGSWNTHLSLVGESKDSTIITYGDFFNKMKRGPNSTFLTATLTVEANDFQAKNLTIINSAGPVAQALALSVTGTRCYFENCSFIGNQDTLYAAGEGAYQYYKNCYIEGTVDFIFGPATALFEKCRIYCKQHGQYITAASTPQTAQYGYVFQNCDISGNAPDNTFALGRPWRPYAKVVYLHCHLGAVIKDTGWDNWRNPENEKTAYYAEYKNTGPGDQPGKRCSWSHQLTDDEAKLYTKKLILNGWEPK